MKIRSQNSESKMRRHKHEHKSPREYIELPVEILELIFLKFTSYVDLFSCARVNTHWQHATQDQRLWKLTNVLQSVYAHAIYPLGLPKRKKHFDWHTAVREYIAMRNNIKLGRCVTKSICTRSLDVTINSISVNEQWAIVNRDENRRCKGAQIYNITSEQLEITDTCCSHLMSRNLVYATRCSVHSKMYCQYTKLSGALLGPTKKRTMKIMKGRDRTINLLRLIQNQDPKSNLIGLVCTNSYKVVVFNIHEEKAEYVYSTEDNKSYYLCGSYLVVADRGKATVVNVLRQNDQIHKIKFSWDGVPVCCLNNDQIILVGTREACLLNLTTGHHRMWHHDLKSIDSVAVHNGLLVCTRYTHVYFIDLRKSMTLNGLVLCGSATLSPSTDAFGRLVCYSTDGIRAVDFSRSIDEVVAIRVLDADASTHDVKTAQMPRHRVMPWIMEQESNNEELLLSFWWKITADERYSIVFTGHSKGNKNKLATKLYKDALHLSEAKHNMPYLAYEFKIDMQVFPERILLLNRSSYPSAVLGTAYCIYEKWIGERWEISTPSSWVIKRGSISPRQ